MSARPGRTHPVEGRRALALADPAARNHADRNHAAKKPAARNPLPLEDRCSERAIRGLSENASDERRTRASVVSLDDESIRVANFSVGWGDSLLVDPRRVRERRMIASEPGPIEVAVPDVVAVSEAARKPSLLECLKRDAARYGEFGYSVWYKELGFWIGATHRYGYWCWSLPFILKLPLSIIYRIVNRFWRLFLHVNISVKADIGPGLLLVHPTSIMIPSTTIGENCLIFHEVTIGSNLTRGGMPKIGNNVDIYVGARVLGGITIGDNAKIGANCVVTSNVAPNAIVFSAATRTLQRRG
jgi:serine O-acetyltransferase